MARDAPEAPGRPVKKPGSVPAFEREPERDETPTGLTSPGRHPLLLLLPLGAGVASALRPRSEPLSTTSRSGQADRVPARRRGDLRRRLWRPAADRATTRATTSSPRGALQRSRPRTAGSSSGRRPRAPAACSTCTARAARRTSTSISTTTSPRSGTTGANATRRRVRGRAQERRAGQSGPADRLQRRLRRCGGHLPPPLRGAPARRRRRRPVPVPERGHPSCSSRSRVKPTPAVTLGLKGVPVSAGAGMLELVGDGCPRLAGRRLDADSGPLRSSSQVPADALLDHSVAAQIVPRRRARAPGVARHRRQPPDRASRCRAKATPNVIAGSPGACSVVSASRRRV